MTLKKKYKNEADLQKNVAKYLNYVLPKGSVFHHSPNEGWKMTIAWKMKLKNMGFRAGWPDLEIFCPESKPIFIELKQPKNYLSPNQKEVKEILCALPVVYAMCRSVNEVAAVLRTQVMLTPHGMAEAILLAENG